VAALTPVQLGVLQRELRHSGIKFCRGCDSYKPLDAFSNVMKTNKKGGKYPTRFYRCRVCVRMKGRLRLAAIRRTSSPRSGS